MRRVLTGQVRPGWEDTIARTGLTYNDTELGDGRTVSYWREGPYYEFTVAEVEYLESCVETLHRMCVGAGDWIVSRCPRRDRDTRTKHLLTSVCNPETCYMSRVGIPEFVHEQVIRTWEDGDVDTWTHADKDTAGRYSKQTPDFSPSVYGRFDLWYGGEGTVPKLLEFNAQTPTSLVESAVTQWEWLVETGQGSDQWNSLHERLVEAWRSNIAQLVKARPWLPQLPKIFFAYETSETSGEDRMNVAYMRETCEQAGFPTELIAMSQIGWNVDDDTIVFRADPDDKSDPGEPIPVIFALYPWEWMWSEEGGKPIFRDMAEPRKHGTVWIEPPYTAALWGNKGLLPVLWELYRDKDEGELLLPAYLEADRPVDMISYARKPIWSREGANVDLIENGELLTHNGGQYGEEGYVVQKLCKLPDFEALDGVAHPVLGAWLVHGEPAGLGIREGLDVDGLVTNNTSHFVPHVIV